MGRVRIIVGRSGSGKTVKCINEFVECQSSLRRLDGMTDAFLIVPEQFSVEYERKVLNHPDCRGLLGSEVISFNRLSRRIVLDYSDDEKFPITASGKAMLLVDVMKKLDDDEKLIFYKKCASNPVCVAGLLETITEFSKYCVSPDLISNAGKLSDDNGTLKTKFNEIALIYSEFEKSFSERYTDSSYFIKKAASMISEGLTDLSHTKIWIDGFSGFTEEELCLLNAFAENASELTLCLFYDEDNSLIFNCPNKTYFELYNRFYSKGHSVEIINATDFSGKRWSKENSAINHLEKNFGRISVEKFDEVILDEISVCSCSDIYQEIENCALKIVDLIKNGYFLKDIAVVSSNLEENASVFNAVFSSLKIPVFVDVKKDISGHPVVRYAMAFFDVLSDGMTPETVITMLKTGLYKAGLFDNDTISRLENLVLSHGVSSGASWKKMCERLNNRYNDSIPREILLANDIYETIYGEEGLVKKIKNLSTISEVCCAVVEFFKSISLEASVSNYCEKLSNSGYNESSDSYIRVWNVFVDTLQEASDIVGGLKIAGYKKLCSYLKDILRAAFSSHKIGFIPFSSQCVQIGNIERSRYLDKKVVFVIGANEGVFPKSFSESGILSDKERTILKNLGAELAYSSTERTLFAQYNIYSVLVSASEKLYISYSNRSKSGDVLYAAPSVSSVLRIFPEIKTSDIKSISYGDKFINTNIPDITCDDDGHISVKINIDKQLVNKLLNIGVDCKLSISNIETYSSCPYRHYLQYVLKLTERKVGKINKADIGEYFHGVVEKASYEVMSLCDKDKNIAEIIKTAAEEFLLEADNADLKYLFENSNKNFFLKERVDSFAEYEVDNIISISEETKMVPAETELSFGMSDDSKLDPVNIDCDGVQLKLRGIIDRVDIRERDGKKEIAIIDYKSSSRYVLSEADVINGLKLQLMTYFMAVEDNKRYFSADIDNVVPSAVMYYIYGKDIKSENFHDYNGLALPGTFDESLKNVKAADLSELKLAAIENIKSIFKDMSSGDFSVSPCASNKNLCDFCKGGNICKYKTFSVDDGNET